MTIVIHRSDAEHSFRWFTLDGATFEVRDAGWGNGSWSIIEATSQSLVGDAYAYLGEVRERGADDAADWIKENAHCFTCGSFDGIYSEDDQWTCNECGDEFSLDEAR